MISSRLLRSLRSEFRQSHLAKLGLLLIIAILVMAIFAPVLATHDPTRTGHFDEHGNSYPPWGFSHVAHMWEDGERISYETTPSDEHYLGTNNIGQDVFSRFVYGARTSLFVGVLGTFIALLIGVPFGLISGYLGGRIDDGMMRIADVMLAFPALVLALALIGVFGAGALHIPDPIVALGNFDDRPATTILPGTVTLVVALVTWVWFARVARGEAISIRNEDYVKAAKSVGASDARILLTHVLPNSLTPVIVLATIQVAVIILLESALSFLGFSGTTLSWGYEIQQGQDYLSSAWWVATVPGIGIVIAVIGINLLGDWLRDSLDPNIAGERGG